MTRFNPRRMLYRSWFYFRVGYGTYIALLVGIAGNLLLFYRLGVQYIDFLADLFPSLTFFTIVAIIVTVPASIGFGYYHMKRTGAFAADAAVSTEQNPLRLQGSSRKRTGGSLPGPSAHPQGSRKSPRKAADHGRREEGIRGCHFETNRLIEGQMVRAS